MTKPRYLFTGRLNSWNGEEYYNLQKKALNRQINKLLSIQSALGQTSQGYAESKEHLDQRRELENEEKTLTQSIANALGIYEKNKK